MTSSDWSVQTSCQVHWVKKDVNDQNRECLMAADHTPPTTRPQACKQGQGRSNRSGHQGSSERSARPQGIMEGMLEAGQSLTRVWVSVFSWFSNRVHGTENALWTGHPVHCPDITETTSSHVSEQQDSLLVVRNIYQEIVDAYIDTTLFYNISLNAVKFKNPLFRQELYFEKYISYKAYRRIIIIMFFLIEWHLKFEWCNY